MIQKITLPICSYTGFVFGVSIKGITFSIGKHKQDSQQTSKKSNGEAYTESHLKIPDGGRQVNQRYCTVPLLLV